MRRVPLLGLLRGVAATSSAATPCITIPNTFQQGGTSTIPHTHHSSAATVISPPPRRRSLMMRPLLATCSSSTSDAGLASPSSTTAVAYTTCRMKTTTTGNKNSGCTKKKKAKPVVTKKKQQAAIAASSTGKGKGGAATKKKPEKKTKVVEDGKRRTSAAVPKKKEKNPSAAVRAKRLESDIESNVGDATEVGGVEAELLHATKTTPTTNAKKPTVESSSSSPPRVAPAVEQRTRFAMRELMTSYFRQAKRPEDKKRMEKQEAIRQREELMAQMRESSAAAIANIPTWDATIMAPGVAKNENSRFSGVGVGAASPLSGGDGGVLEGRLRTDTGLFDGSDRKNLPLKSDSPSSNKLGADVTLRGSQLAEHDLKAMRLRKHHLSSATDDDDDEALEEDREVADEGEEQLLPPPDDAGRDDDEEEDVMMVENNTQEVFTGLGGRGTPTKHNETAASFMSEEEEEASRATTHLHHHHNEPYQDHAYHDPFSDDDDDDDEQPMILGREGKAAVVR